MAFRTTVLRAPFAQSGSFTHRAASQSALDQDHGVGLSGEQDRPESREELWHVAGFFIVR